MSLFGSFIEEENKQPTTILSIPFFEDVEMDQYLQEDTIDRVNLPGHVDGGNRVKIEVYTNEGENVPHFHIKNGNGFLCCVQIYHCKYFSHGIHQDVLTKKQAKFLDKILRSTLKNNPSRTIWQEIVRVWCRYPEYPIDGLLPNASDQPDYSGLSDVNL